MKIKGSRFTKSIFSINSLNNLCKSFLSESSMFAKTVWRIFKLFSFSPVIFCFSIISSNVFISLIRNKILGSNSFMKFFSSVSVIIPLAQKETYLFFSFFRFSICFLYFSISFLYFSSSIFSLFGVTLKTWTKIACWCKIKN